MKKTIILLFYFSLFTFHLLHSQWVQQSVPVSKPITGIKFIDSLKGWACTSIGTGGANYAYILHTTNGGINWFLQDSSFNTDYNALSVIDANIAYAGGDSVGYGKLAKTTNGGLNWIYLQLPINMWIDDMVFLNKDSGWACAYGFGADVRTTTNGGLNWIVRINGIASQTQRLFFLNYSTGFCGAGSNLYKTSDAGSNWVLNGNFSEFVYGIFFPNDAIGWLGMSGGKIASTINGGSNWFIQQPFSLIGNNVTDIFFCNSNIGWAAVGSLQKTFKTTNGGVDWGYQVNPSTALRISFIDTLKGWGGNFGISHTTNGGGPITYLGIISITNTIPEKFKLYQNYPNPFNPKTTINFDIKTGGFVKLVVFDVLGRELVVLINKKLAAGSYENEWDGSNIQSGVYFYRLTAENYSETKKMVLIK